MLLLLKVKSGFLLPSNRDMIYRVKFQICQHVDALEGDNSIQPDLSSPLHCQGSIYIPWLYPKKHRLNKTLKMVDL